MSERDQTPTQPDEPGREHDPVAPIANRPANAGQTVDTTGHTRQDWRGAQDASDFLGLSQEISSSQLSAPSLTSTDGSSVDPASDLPGGPSSSWLLSLDEARAAGADDDATHAGTADAASDTGDAEDAETDPAADPDGVPSVGTGRDRRWLLAGVAAAVIAGVGYFVLGPGLRPSAPPPARPSIAHKPPAPGAKTPPSTTTAPTAGPADPTAHVQPAPDVVPAPVAPVAPVATGDGGPGWTPAHESVPSSHRAVGSPPDLATRFGAERLNAWLRAHGWTRPIDPAELPTGDDGSPAWLTIAMSGGLPLLGEIPILAYALPAADPLTASYGPLPPAGFAPGAAAPGALRPGASPRIPASAASRTMLRFATADDLAGVWEGNVVPMEAIDATSRILTPGVGRVRVLLKSGEIFEGRLYAVGEGQVWLDTELGRMALFGPRVSKVQQIATPGSTTGPGQVGSGELASLPRMRVRMPGGLFYGKVVARDEKTVTLITEEGARITLESTDVEPAPTGVIRVVGTIKP